jgi:membrane associated rhomboid family serine protease
VLPVAGRFQFSTPSRRGANDPWFRVGEIDIGTSPLVAIAAALSFLVYAIEGPSHPVIDRMILYPDRVLNGEVWRIVTWPFANSPDIWTAITIALLWMFGSRLEEVTGRVKMAGFFAAIIVIPAIVGTLLDLPQAGIRAVEFVVLLTFIAENPFVRFFFGIPAWVLGAVFVGLEFLQLVGDRDGRGLIFYLITFVVAAIAARTIGLFDAYPWIPAIPLPRRGHHRPTRSSSGRTKAPSRGSGQVVEGPWSAPPPPRPSPDAAAAQAELDSLLDKISATGLDSLTADEKRRLNELSKRLR